MDEDGIVHYGDSPPDKTKAERVDIPARSTERKPPASTKMVEDAEESYRRLEEERKLKRAGRLATDQAEEIAAGQERMREKRCEVARLKLKEAQQDNKAPRQEIRDAQTEVNQYCGTE